MKPTGVKTLPLGIPVPKDRRWTQYELSVNTRKLHDQLPKYFVHQEKMPELTPPNRALWEKIQTFLLDVPNASFSFSDRLARENGWDYLFALRAIEEYKRFMFLICIAPHTLTPSDEVDQVWHLHLIYTQSYWIDFCEQTLGKQIHHGPTKGGGDERNKFEDWYTKTKILYEETFGQLPPPDLWPPGDKRFADIDFQRVNKRQHWIIRKPKFLQK
jgi:hypothetical protein